MASKKENAELVKAAKSTSQLDVLAQKILTTIDAGYSERRRLARSDSRMQKEFEREFSIVKRRSRGSYVDFLGSMNIQSTRQNTKGNSINKGKNATVDPYELFTQNTGDVYNYFKDSNQSKYLQVSDLKFISKFIPILGAAVKTALNSVTASDTISDTIARKIELGDISNDDKATIIDTIEQFERQKKLLRKLKNITIKKTLVSGESFIYAIKYSDLFEQYAKVKAKRTNNMANTVQRPSIAKESIDGEEPEIVMESYACGWDFNVGAPWENGLSSNAMESVITNFKQNFADFYEDPSARNTTKQSNVLKKDMGKYETDGTPYAKAIDSEIRGFMESFHLIDSPIPYPAMEDAKVYELEKYRNTYGGNHNADVSTAGGEVSANTSETNKKKDKFDDINGLYIKFIDAKNLVEIKAFDTVFGYFYLYTTPKSSGPSVGYNKTNMISTGSHLFNTVNMGERRKEAAAIGLVDEISRRVLESFSSKFVTANPEYIDLISDVIIANGLVDQDFNIQFIPAEYMIAFKINEDENGNGESIIADSLFAAKLMLYLLTTQLLNYINLSGNRQIAHIQKGPIDTNTSNHIQDVIRNLQETKVSFNDLLSTNLVYSKLSRNTNLALPQSRNGTHLVEFETQEGQQVDMDTDMLEKLEELVSIGSSVPITKEALTNPQFAKQLESENIQYAGQVASWQSDLEGPLTDLYCRIIEASNLADDLKTTCLNTMEIKLPRPKAFENTNNSDFLSTALSMVQQAVSVYVGENNNDESAAVKKDKLTMILMEDATPFIDWNKMRDAEKRIEIEIEKENAKKKAKEDAANSSMSGGSGEADLGGEDDMGDDF